MEDLSKYTVVFGSDDDINEFVELAFQIYSIAKDYRDDVAVHLEAKVDKSIRQYLAYKVLRLYFTYLEKEVKK